MALLEHRTGRAGIMSERGGHVEDGSGDMDGFELGGGPLLPGVDYEAAWLVARSAADDLNTVFTRLGLTSSLLRAQAGWADNGRGVVYLVASPMGARKLLRALDRLDRGTRAA
jgi:hypothetical protein